MFLWKKGIVLLIISLLLIMTACGNETESDSGNESVSETDNPIEITWWHSMSGDNGSHIDKLVEDFNNSQSDIQVEAVYQGSYADSLAKLMASLQGGENLILMQATFSVSTATLIDSGAVAPMQYFIDNENYDLSQLEENILANFQYQGKLFSMPFNASTLIMYYNKDMFEDKGLDPDNPPKTYEELLDVAKQLTGDGKYGASFGIDSWFIEQLIAVQGFEIVDNGNGREGRAEKSLLNSEGAIKTFNMWKEMIEKGYMLNLGSNNRDTFQAFTSEQVGMTLGSTANVRTMLDNSEGKFEMGTAFLPKPKDSDEGGATVSGASLYIMNNKPQEEQNAAWDFVKYLMEPEQQAYFHLNTGYFPVNKAAYDLPEVVENMENYPQFETALLQMQNAVDKNSSRGAILGVYPQARKITVETMEKVISGTEETKSALDSAASQITELIEGYNVSVEE